MRIAAIDYGSVRIGLAITDISKTIAYPLTTVQTQKSFEKASQNILGALKEYLQEIELIIIGLPLHMKGQDSAMTKQVREFFEFFKMKTKIPIKLFDERLSSKMAERHLKDNINLNRKKRSKKIDPIAATFILQTYLGTA